MMKRSLPLRTRLALGYTAFFTAVLVLIGLGVFLSVQEALIHEITQQLTASGELIQQDFDASNAELGEYFSDATFLLRTHAPRVEGLESPDLYVQAVTPDRVVAVTSASLQGQQLPLTEPARRDALAGKIWIGDAQLGEAPIRLLARPLHTDQNIVGILLVAQPLREVDRTLRLLMISLAATGLVAILAVIRGGAWLASRALLPVGQIAATAQQIVRAEDLVRRIGGNPTADEIGQLTATIDEMLERLERLFNAQRRFVADVSHELRTPLTAMRGNIEILRRGAARDPRALDESLADMEREVNRLTRLASDLLLLAQAEAGARLRHEPVPLDELVLEVVRELYPLASGIALMPEIAEQIAVYGDRDRIKQALLNLVTNAIQYTPPGSSIRVALDRTDGCACLRVSDTGMGIGADHLPHIFDRFYRADRARARGTGGAGLGLAIVKWIAEAHHGAVTVTSTPGAGSTFVMSLPIEAAHTDLVQFDKINEIA